MGYYGILDRDRRVATMAKSGRSGSIRTTSTTVRDACGRLSHRLGSASVDLLGPTVIPHAQLWQPAGWGAVTNLSVWDTLDIRGRWTSLSPAACDPRRDG